MRLTAVQLTTLLDGLDLDRGSTALGGRGTPGRARTDSERTRGRLKAPRTMIYSGA